MSKFGCWFSTIFKNIQSYTENIHMQVGNIALHVHESDPSSLGTLTVGVVDGVIYEPFVVGIYTSCRIYTSCTRYSRCGKFIYIKMEQR